MTIDKKLWRNRKERKELARRLRIHETNSARQHETISNY
jgi:hypothetical protein